MTVKELIKELQKMPEDAVVLGDPYLNQDCIIDNIEYDKETNTVSFYGEDIFEFEESNPCNGDCMECHESCQMNQDIPDDADGFNPLWRLRYARDVEMR